MSWKEEVVSKARALGRNVIEHAMGVGIEFGDGGDVFWILPGEVTSTVEGEGAVDADAFIDAYQRIGRVREGALHVLEHHLRREGWSVSKRAVGRWDLENGGVSTSWEVGSFLTSVARDTGSVAATVAARFKDHYIKPPSEEQIGEYLAMPFPVSDGGDGAKDAGSLFPETIRSVLAMMGLCRSVAGPELESVEEFVEAASPKGRIAQTLLRVGRRIPYVKASLELSESGTVLLAFEDGLASFSITARSRALVRRIRAIGPMKVGDELADAYLRLNAARGAILRAIYQVAVARGWRQETVGFVGIMHLGSSLREISFEPGDALTDVLREKDPHAALAEIFPGQEAFVGACREALLHPLKDDAARVQEGRLLPRGIPKAPKLLELTADLMRETDAWASGVLRAYLGKKDSIWHYRNRDIYDPAVDTWAKLTDWTRLAESKLCGERLDPYAINILLDAGDSRGDAMARATVEDADPDAEPWDAEVELVWRYRHLYPEQARRWFLPKSFEDVPFAKVRAALGDPIALRARKLELMRDDDYAATPPTEKHRELLEWARTEHRWSFPSEGKMRTACEMGWSDVAAALLENPYLLAGLLTTERRDDQFDEPGMLGAGSFLLTWSRLLPGEFLARLIVTGLKTDLVGLAEQASRVSIARRPELAENLESSMAIYRTWRADMEPPLAIAWTRCRPLIG